MSKQAVTLQPSAMTFLYWRVGERIRREVLLEARADYGIQILATLSQELTRDYGKGFKGGNA